MHLLITARMSKSMTDGRVSKKEIRHYGCKACGRSFDVPVSTVEKAFIASTPIKCLCGAGRLQPKNIEDEFPWDVAKHGKAPWWMPFLFTGEEGIRSFVETCEFSRWASAKHQPFPHEDFAQWLQKNFRRPLSPQAAAWMFLLDIGLDPRAYPFDPAFKLYVVNNGRKDQFLPPSLVVNPQLRACEPPPSAGLDLSMLEFDEACRIAIEDAEHYFSQIRTAAAKWYGISIATAQLSFDLEDNALAGLSRYSLDQGGRHRIALNRGLMHRDPEDAIQSTLPHEIAHICAWEIFGTGILAHGPEWRSLMHFFNQADRICREARADSGKLAAWELESARKGAAG